MSIKVTHDIFIDRLSKINKNIEVIGKYIGARIPIRCRCKLDGYEWEAMPCNLTHKNNPTGCPMCKGGTHLVIQGVNDLHTTHPHIASMLKDKTLGYKYSHGSELRTEWICPRCNNRLEKF